MEVLSSRLNTCFKEDSWKCKRGFESKSSPNPELKVEVRSERPVNYEARTSREGDMKKPYPVSLSVWDNKKRQPPGRSGVHSKGGGASAGYPRKQEEPVESSDNAETSQEGQGEDSDHSEEDEPASIQVSEEPQKWPIIQVVDPPAWLPEGWTAVLRTRESGSKDKYYVDPISKRRFRSKTEVNYYLQTGRSYRYKRNLALLTKPLKEDPVSLPSSAALRGLAPPESVQESDSGLPNSSPSNGERKSSGAVSLGANQPPDLRLSILPPQAERPRKPYNKPGPKPKNKLMLDEPPRSVTAAPKRTGIEDRKVADVSQDLGQVSEKRGKLILKLKRKAPDLDEGEKRGKKLRPFEVVGGVTVHHGKSRSATSDEGEKNRDDPLSLDHTVDSTGKGSHSSMIELSPVPRRRPGSKTPPPPGLRQHLHSLPITHPHLSGSANQLKSSSAHSQHLDRTSGSASLFVTDSENAQVAAPAPVHPGPQKKESPAEQLQKLGRKLCFTAVDVLSSRHGRSSNALKLISDGLRVSMRPAFTSGFKPELHTIPSSGFNAGFQTSSPHPVVRRIKGGSGKAKGAELVQKHSSDQHRSLVPQTQ